ncbi:MAG: helix-turn-helix domain-containing protein [bacterium]
MDKNLVKILNVEFTSSEVSAYLACLELGKATIIQIAKKSGLKRTTVYNIVETLLEKGLLSKFEDQRGQKFLAESPEKLITIFQKREEELSKILPNLLAITNTGDSDIKPEVKFYQGKEGLIAVYEDTLASCQKGDEILSCASAENVSFLSDYLNSYIDKRAEKGISMRVIARDSQETRYYKRKDKQHLRRIKIMPENEFLVNIEKNIYKDKVALMNFRGIAFGVIIRSSQIAKSEKEIFESLWKRLPT